MSSVTLETPAIELLDKGLTYIPTINKIPVEPIADNFNKLRRRLILADYFQDRPTQQQSEFSKLFVEPSTWTPSLKFITEETRTTIRNIAQFINSNIRNYSIDIKGRKYVKLPSGQTNLTSQELVALNTLKNNKSIIIKPADKGGAIVVMSKESYLKEGLRQLTNPDYYTELDYPIFPSNVKKINDILTRILRKGLISEKQYSYLKASPFDKQRYFYLLPKVHKERAKWPNNDMPEGRPIVADCHSESYKVSQYIDYFLKPLAKKHESYIKDTYDFISKIRDLPMEKDWLLVTADVTALYTNMKIDIMLETVMEMFTKYPDPRRPDAELIELLELTLRNNDFEFAGRIFLQTVGTAMGKRYAPHLADIYMERFDRHAKYGFDVKLYHYFRFLDDIFFVWCSTREKLGDYQTYLNSLIPGIKVTFTVREYFTEFLDVRIYKSQDMDGNWKLKTKVYFKPTDTHQLLHRRSFHPGHACKGVLKSQFIRFKRISSCWEDYNEASTILWNTLKNRGYTRSLYFKLKRDIWLNYHDKTRATPDSEREIIPVVTHFDPFNRRISNYAKNEISNNPHLTNFEVISAYKIHRNLRRHLINNSQA